MNELRSYPDDAQEFGRKNPYDPAENQAHNRPRPKGRLSRTRKIIGTAALLGAAAFGSETASAQQPATARTNERVGTVAHSAEFGTSYAEVLSRLENKFQKLTPQEVVNLTKQDREQAFFIVGKNPGRAYFKDAPSESGATTVSTSLASRKEINELSRGSADIDYYAHGHTHPNRETFPNQTMNPPSQEDFVIALRNAAKFAGSKIKCEEMVLDRGGIWQIDIVKNSALLGGLAEFDRLKGEFYLELTQAGQQAEAKWLFKRFDRLFTEAEIGYLQNQPDQASKNFAARLKQFMNEHQQMAEFLRNMEKINNRAQILSDNAGADQSGPGAVSARTEQDYQTLKDTALKFGMGINYLPYTHK